MKTKRGLFAAIRSWLLLAVTLAATLALWIANRLLGEKAVTGTLSSLKEMLFFLPPSFIILGLLDAWVPCERMVKFRGEGSGGDQGEGARLLKRGCAVR